MNAASSPAPGKTCHGCGPPSTVTLGSHAATIDVGFANDAQFQSTRTRGPARKQRLSERTSRWQSGSPATGRGVGGTQDDVEIALEPAVFSEAEREERRWILRDRPPAAEELGEAIP